MRERAYNEQRTTNSEEHATNNEQRTTNSEEQTTNSERRAVSRKAYLQQPPLDVRCSMLNVHQPLPLLPLLPLLPPLQLCTPAPLPPFF